MAGDGKKDPNATKDSKRQRKYNSKPKNIKKTAARNKARRESGLKVGDERDVDHKDGNALNNAKSNRRVMSRKKNRSRNNNK